MPDVSVIIVTWNSATVIGPCLTSLQNHGGDTSFEVIVADNGSSDDTCGVVEQHPLGCRLFRFGANLGFPKANNLAAAQAQGTYVFFLNPDTCLSNNAIDVLRQHLDASPAAGIVGPGIVAEDGKYIAVDARSFPTLRGTAFRYFGLRSLFPDHPLFGGAYLSPAKRNHPQSVDCLTGAAMFLTRDLFLEVGGFDEQLPMYFEDIDLCGKIRANGRECGYVPHAHVEHAGGESTAQSPIARFLMTLEDGQAPWMYFSKYRSAMAARSFVLILAAGNVFRLGLYLLAAPAALLPTGRDTLRRRIRDALTLLGWCLRSKQGCIAKSQALFDPAPRSDASLAPEERPRDH